MRWQDKRESDNVEDRRGHTAGVGGFPVRGKTGLLLIAVVVIAGFYGIDLTPLLTGGSGLVSTGKPPVSSGQGSQDLAHFSSVILGTTEDTWSNIFRQEGKTYHPPKMVLYTDATPSACGYGQSAMGPFYCPSDQSVYLDLSFFQDMKDRLGGGGDFAQGYVIAHEVGHHIQNLLGISDQVRKLQRGASPEEANQLSVRLELQADCFAGVWGHSMSQDGILETGDLEEALRTAEAIGDDRLQQQSTGRVTPDSFTHGTSQQRYTWFKRGFDSGNPGDCDTFDKKQTVNTKR